MGVELGIDVDADVVGRKDRLFACAAHHQLDGFQRDPRDFMEHGQDDGTLAQAHLGAEESGADEAHVGRCAFVDPNRDDVEDRDKDDRDDEETDSDFKHRAVASYSEDLAVPLDHAGASRASERGAAAALRRSPKSNSLGGLRLRGRLSRSSSVARRSTSRRFPASTTPYSSRAFSVLINRRATSLRTRVGLRSSGSPQPPPPAVRTMTRSPTRTRTLATL